MASRTDEPRQSPASSDGARPTARTSRRGLLAGAAGLVAVLLGRRASRSGQPRVLDSTEVDGRPRRSDGKIRWIGHD